MKRFTKAAIAALGAALVSQAAQAGYVANDLVLGFDLSSAANDYVVDLGQVATTGSSVVDLSSQFSLSTFNSTFSGGLNGVSMAVVGGKSVLALSSSDIFATALRTSNIGTPGVAGSTISPLSVSGGLKNGVGDVSVMVTDLGLSGGLSTTTARSGADSFNAKVAPTLAAGSYYGDTGLNPLGTATGNIIYEDLYEEVGTGNLTYQGYFTLDLSGDGGQLLTYTPAGSVAVPEPTTYGILSGLGLLALTVRRQFARNV